MSEGALPAAGHIKVCCRGIAPRKRASTSFCFSLVQIYSATWDALIITGHGTPNRPKRFAWSTAEQARGRRKSRGVAVVSTCICPISCEHMYMFESHTPTCTGLSFVRAFRNSPDARRMPHVNKRVCTVTAAEHLWPRPKLSDFRIPTPRRHHPPAPHAPSTYKAHITSSLFTFILRSSATMKQVIALLCVVASAAAWNLCPPHPTSEHAR